MKKIKDLILDYFDVKHIGLGKTILAGLVVMVPLFLIVTLPSIIFYSMDPAISYEKYPWLETFSWVWILCSFGAMFLTVVIYLIVTGIRDMQWNKKFHDDHPELKK
jgi:uncharacterized membrane protein